MQNFKKILNYIPYAVLAMLLLSALLLADNAARKNPVTGQEEQLANVGRELLTLSPATLYTPPSPEATVGAAPLPTMLFALPKIAATTGIVAPRRVAIGALLALIALIYFAAKSTIGKNWALLPAFLAAFSPTMLGYGAVARPEIVEALTIFLSLFVMTAYFMHPSKKLLLFSGIALGAALAASFNAITLPLLYFMMFGILYGASIAFDWENTDPATRGYRFRVRAWRYASNCGIIFFIAAALLYGFYALVAFPLPLTAQVAATQLATPSVFINWLSGNVALRPLGAYAAGLAGYFSATQPNFAWISAFALHESIPALLLILFGLCSGGFHVFISAISMIKNRMPLLLNYIGTRPREFTLQFFIALFLAGALTSSANGSLIKIILLPSLFVLASQPVKNWFSIFDNDLNRNMVLKVLIFANSLASLSLKTLALIMGLIWYFATAIAAGPGFLGYGNIFLR